jgi:hypothetical protein
MRSSHMCYIPLQEQPSEGNEPEQSDDEPAAKKAKPTIRQTVVRTNCDRHYDLALNHHDHHHSPESINPGSTHLKRSRPSINAAFTVIQ